MTTLSSASTFNAEATLNAWMQAALEAVTLPSHLDPLPALVFTVPQTTAIMPCFSLIHIPVDAVSPWQGRRAGEGKGLRTRGILDVSCWVSRSASANWLMQLRTMRDMVLSAVAGDVVVIIDDYAGFPPNTVAPAITADALLGVQITGDDGTWSDDVAATTYKINIDGAALTPTEADTNPDVERLRVLIDYSFVFRTT